MPGGATDLERAVTVFAHLRPRLFGIAYRMLGSATEAEDLVQEAWPRWQTTDRSVVTDPAAFLSATVTRLAINAPQSARVRCETYIGPRLPEPDGVTVDWVETNGQTSALISHDGALSGTITVCASAEGIDKVLWMFNPEKITELSLPAGHAFPVRFADVRAPRQ
ncbi:hypothetical protein GCM10009838_66630 [Catenulispora subtropica]|uniref:RNA polymerase sigma-70 region 2 domain-containing protein n=1 Tax=Catenulispora subtropica TaxID=450798 RepID=A0ABN2SWH8_9ACTN